MKNLQHMIYSMFAVTMFMPCSGYATTEFVELKCCTDSTCPTKFESRTEPGIKQTATLIGVRVPDIHLPDELQMDIDNEELRDVIPLSRGPDQDGYVAWKKKAISILGKTDETRRLLTVSQTDLDLSITGECSSSRQRVHIHKPGKIIECNAEDVMTLDQDRPKCENCETGPRTVIEITKTKVSDEELAAIEAAKAKASAEEQAKQHLELAIKAQRELDKKQAEIARIDKGIAEKEACIAANNKKVAENNKKVTKLDKEMKELRVSIGAKIMKGFKKH